MGLCLFKNAIKPQVGNSFVTLYQAPADKASLMLQLNGSVTATSGLIGSARIVDVSTGVTSFLIKQAPIPAGDTIRLIDQAKIILEGGDRIEVQCDSTNEKIDFVGSLVEDVNDTGGSSLGVYKNAVKQGIGNSWVDLYVAPANKTTFFLQINAANTSNTGVQVSVRVFDASENKTASLLDGGQIPLSDSIRLIDHAKVILEPGDKLQIKCNTTGETVDVVGCYIEDVNQV